MPFNPDSTQLPEVRKGVQVTASRNLTLSDRNCHLYSLESTAITLIIVANTFTKETEIELGRLGSGSFIVLAGSGVSLNGVLAGSKSIALQYQAIVIRRISTNNWVAYGNYS